MTDASAPDVRTGVLSLNSPTAPFVYTVDGDTITGRWNFDNTNLATSLSDGGASANFRYIVTLTPENRAFRCVEQDAGYNNGQIRAYSGYSRNYSGNVFTLILGLIQRADRKKRTGQAKPAHKYKQEELKAPLRGLLDTTGWTRKGLIR
ncbi:hypothetical protein [Glaciihabitans sp. UYNi722]|uniref:hypothetical protein n=1 Tax=Glaciihabitans sp. UYNi722 TaxID=3156344 RepID=UPI0033993F6E